jgi:GNAT superfamily N-acetyltransferase
MIRDYQPTDLPAIARMLTAPGGHGYTKPLEQVEQEIAPDFAASRVRVYDDGAVKGYSLLDIGARICQVIQYTAPAHRRQGIGSRLFDESMRILSEIDPNTIWFFYRQDAGNSRAFFQSQGCQVWYAYHHMRYTGPRFPEPAIEARTFEEQFFEPYLQGRSAAFLPSRKEIGFVPHAEAEKREPIHRYVTENRDHVFLFFDRGEFVGSAAIAGGYLLDDVFVCPAHQGKGYGKAIVQHVVNRILERGLQPELAVVTVNTTAKHLYDRVGFELIQTLEMSRRFSPNKEPDLSSPGA